VGVMVRRASRTTSARPLPWDVRALELTLVDAASS
jgi:hypothetical protein